MPPKVKFSKEEIINKAYEIMTESGIEAVVAREVGKRLGSTTAPIFTYYNTMDELKNDVTVLAKNKFIDYEMSCLDYKPAFKEFGLRWIRFSKNFPNIYRLLFGKGFNFYEANDYFKKDFAQIYDLLIVEIVSSFQIEKSEAETLFSDMMIFAHGIASFVIQDPNSFSEEKATQVIGDVCIGLVNNMKLRNGSFILPQGKAMAMGISSKPIKNK